MQKYNKHKQAVSSRTKKMEKLLATFRKLDKVRKQIIREIESDFLFNNLTSFNQSYSI